MFKIILCDASNTFLKAVTSIIQSQINMNNMSASIVLSTDDPKLVIQNVTTDEFYFVLLDVTIKNDGDGINTADSVRQINKNAHIVFGTRHTEYMVKVFKNLIRPSGFLVKPINKNELIELFCEIYSEFKNLHMKDGFFSLTTNGTIYRIGFGDIVYFEAFQKKIHLHTNSQTISFYNTLSEIHQMLDNRFVRCHKSYIVNIENIKDSLYSEMELKLSNGDSVPISRGFKADVKAALKSP